MKLRGKRPFPLHVSVACHLHHQEDRKDGQTAIRTKDGRGKKTWRGKRTKHQLESLTHMLTHKDLISAKGQPEI